MISVQPAGCSPSWHRPEYWEPILRSCPELIQATIPRSTEYIRHRPTPKQTAFLLLDCLDALFGGSAGSGKSSALLMAALQYVDVPGYNAILLRDTYQNLALPEGLMTRADDWLANTSAKWHSSEKRWSFPSGATLSFGYLDGPRDHHRYQSSAFQFVGLDEAVQFREHQALYLFSRLRRLTGTGVPLRFRCASNPPDRHQVPRGLWVRDRYVDPGNDAKPFIPATRMDNPWLDVAEYEKSLSQLDPVTRQQLLDGDWNIRPGGALVDREWFRLVDRAECDVARVRAWDLAATANEDACYTAGALIARNSLGMTWIEDMVHLRGEPARVQRIVRHTADVDGPEIKILIEQEPGSAGKSLISFYRQILSDRTFYGIPVSGDKLTRLSPFLSQAEGGTVALVRGQWNRDYLDELSGLPNSRWDQADATSLGYNWLAVPRPGVW